MASDYKGGLARYRRYMQTMQREPVWRASFVVVMSLGLVILLVVSALRPTLVTIAGLLGQIGQEKTVEEKMDQKIVAIQKANEEFQKYQGRFAILDIAVPRGPQWGDFAQEVARAASESGVELRSLTFGPVGGTNMVVPEVGGVNFSLTGTGPYSSLRKFVAMIGRSKRIAVVSTATITADTLSVRGAVGFFPETGGE